METTLDKFGRIVIPKRVRDDLGLKPGAVLQIEQAEQKILMVQAHRQERLSEAGSGIKK
ncbi:MAG: AbrB/MazE/SpoVT family DNA-binding domain-containing protein [Deltaproteobacteria bacterium]|nr:AbrB/MazE/SpoVT family DNA-binding domain-containing protein [Deltaproteobacteria bacterium]